MMDLKNDIGRSTDSDVVPAAERRAVWAKPRLRTVSAKEAEHGPATNQSDGAFTLS